MVKYTEFLYISVPDKNLSIKPKTIAYVTQLTSLNTCVLHLGYIQLIQLRLTLTANGKCAIYIHERKKMIIMILF